MELSVETSLLRKPRGWGARHTLAILGFWGMALSYAMRFNLSIAIVAMVGNKGRHSSQNRTAETCSELLPPSHGNNSGGPGSDPGDDGEFDWSSTEQGVILGSFFWGYVSTQLLGGILATKYGGKWPLGLGILLTAIFAILIPVAARTHKYLLIFARVVQGMGEGTTFPAMHAILAKWAPAEEKSIMSSIVYAGTQFGTAAALIMSGYLIDGNIMEGWPSVFYVFGILSIVWFIFWCLLMYESPGDHPRISSTELHFIRRSIGRGEKKDKMPTPWTSILSSMPFWAIQIGHAGHAWGLYTLLAQMPTYMKTVLHFDIKQNSWMSATPYIVMWLVGLFTSQIADNLISQKVLTTVAVRKLAQGISQLGPALALVAASFSGCDRLLTVALLTIGVGLNGFVYAGYIANHAEIASNHAGILMGITNTFANLCGFGAPYVAGLLLEGETSLRSWQYVFFLSAGIYVFNAIFYGLFGSATEQPWNRPKGSRTRSEEAPVAYRRASD